MSGHRVYTFEVTVHEGNDEFWESLTGSGCDEVTQAVRESLMECGFDVELECLVKLVSFQNR